MTYTPPPLATPQVVVPPARSEHVRLRRYLSLDDFEKTARRRLPRQIFGYYAGGAETEQSLRSNFVSFRDIALIPRVLTDVAHRTTTTRLFDQTYSMPVGIAPMGLSGLSTFEGDLVLAKAARAANALMVASATSIMPLERICSEGGATWFQCYLPGEKDRILAMIDRVRRAGFETLVLTADVPVAANRENNIRTGFKIPLRPTPRLLWDGITHPRWSVGTFLRTLSKGMPHFENMDAFRGPAMLSSTVVRDIGKRDGLSWKHVDLIRQNWPGKLIVKGLLHPNDVSFARESGVDGIWVSNHGGRQLDSAVSPMRMLPAIRAQAGNMAVLIDSGIRRGTDVLKAIALGADFVFVGRPFLFAAAVAGEAGVRHALGLLNDELDRDMALMGLRNLKDLTSEQIKT